MFGKNVNEDEKDDIMALWGCRAMTQYEKYLGLPLIVGRSRERTFSKIKIKL